LNQCFIVEHEKNMQLDRLTINNGKCDNYYFEWDPQKAAINLKKHRVKFEKAATIFKDRTVIHQQSGEGISQALIYIHSITQDISQSTQTNENCEFKLKNKKSGFGQESTFELVFNYRLKTNYWSFPIYILLFLEKYKTKLF